MTTAIETHPCIDCGTGVERELPPEGAFGRETLIAFIRCDPCTSRVEAEDAETEAQRAKSAGEHRLRANIAESGLPDALKGLQWTDIQDAGGQAEAISAAQEWGAPGTGLVLTGPVGVGKTRIAATACWALLLRRRCSWVSAPLLFARLGSGLGSEQRDQALDILTSKAALIIDDLDKARPTEYGAEHVFLAVDGRITNNSPLLVTTNLSLSEIAAKFPEPYGEAIASRLAGYCKTITLTGPDRRVA